MKNILLIVIGMFALGLDAFVIAGLLPYVGHDFRISGAAAAQSVTCFTLCYALSAPIFATLLSGKRMKNILLLALFIFTIGNLVSALATNFTLFIVSRCIAGIGAGIFSPLAVASAAALVDPKRKGTALSLALGGMSVGVVLGVPLGLIIAAHSGWHNTLWLIVIIGIIAMCGMYFKFPEIEVPPPPALMQRLAMLKNTRILIVELVSLLTAISSLGLYTFISFIVHYMHVNYSVTNYFWVWGIGGMIGSFSVGRVIDKVRNSRVVMAIILLMLALSLIMIHFVMNDGLLSFIPFFIWGMMGWASQTPQQHTLITIEPKHTSVVVALNSSINYLGGAIGAMLGGLLLTVSTSCAMLINFASCICLIALICQIFICYYDKELVKMNI